MENMSAVSQGAWSLDSEQYLRAWGLDSEQISGPGLVSRLVSEQISGPGVLSASRSQGLASVSEQISGLGVSQ